MLSLPKCLYGLKTQCYLNKLSSPVRIKKKKIKKKRGEKGKEREREKIVSPFSLNFQGLSSSVVTSPQGGDFGLNSWEEKLGVLFTYDY